MSNGNDLSTQEKRRMDWNLQNTHKDMLSVCCLNMFK
jgi:hypothetical protein